MSLTVFLTLQWKYWPYSGTLLLTGGAFGAWFADLLIGQFNAARFVDRLARCIFRGARAFDAGERGALRRGRMLEVLARLVGWQARGCSRPTSSISSVCSRCAGACAGDLLREALEKAASPRARARAAARDSRSQRVGKPLSKPRSTRTSRRDVDEEADR